MSDVALRVRKKALLKAIKDYCELELGIVIDPKDIAFVEEHSWGDTTKHDVDYVEVELGDS